MTNQQSKAIGTDVSDTDRKLAKVIGYDAADVVRKTGGDVRKYEDLLWMDG